MFKVTFLWFLILFVLTLFSLERRAQQNILSAEMQNSLRNIFPANPYETINSFDEENIQRVITILQNNIKQWSFIESQILEPSVNLGMPEIFIPLKHLTTTLELLGHIFFAKNELSEAKDCLERACPLLELLPQHILDSDEYSDLENMNALDPEVHEGSGDEMFPFSSVKNFGGEDQEWMKDVPIDNSEGNSYSSGCFSLLRDIYIKLYEVQYACLYPPDEISESSNQNPNSIIKSRSSHNSCNIYTKSNRVATAAATVDVEEEEGDGNGVVSNIKKSGESLDTDYEDDDAAEAQFLLDHYGKLDVQRMFDYLRLPFEHLRTIPQSQLEGDSQSSSDDDIIVHPFIRLLLEPNSIMEHDNQAPFSLLSKDELSSVTYSPSLDSLILEKFQDKRVDLFHLNKKERGSSVYFIEKLSFLPYWKDYKAEQVHMASYPIASDLPSEINTIFAEISIDMAFLLKAFMKAELDEDLRTIISIAIKYYESIETYYPELNLSEHATIYEMLAVYIEILSQMYREGISFIAKEMNNWRDLFQHASDQSEDDGIVKTVMTGVFLEIDHITGEQQQVEIQMDQNYLNNLPSADRARLSMLCTFEMAIQEKVFTNIFIGLHFGFSENRSLRQKYLKSALEKANSLSSIQLSKSNLMEAIQVYKRTFPELPKLSAMGDLTDNQRSSPVTPTEEFEKQNRAQRDQQQKKLLDAKLQKKKNKRNRKLNRNVSPSLFEENMSPPIDSPIKTSGEQVQGGLEPIDSDWLLKSLSYMFILLSIILWVVFYYMTSYKKSRIGKTRLQGTNSRNGTQSLASEGFFGKRSQASSKASISTSSTSSHKAQSSSKTSSILSKLIQIFASDFTPQDTSSRLSAAPTTLSHASLSTNAGQSSVNKSIRGSGGGIVGSIEDSSHSKLDEFPANDSQLRGSLKNREEGEEVVSVRRNASKTSSSKQKKKENKTHRASAIIHPSAKLIGSKKVESQHTIEDPSKHVLQALSGQQNDETSSPFSEEDSESDSYDDIDNFVLNKANNTKMAYEKISNTSYSMIHAATDSHLGKNDSDRSLGYFGNPSSNLEGPPPQRSMIAFAATDDEGFEVVRYSKKDKQPSQSAQEIHQTPVQAKKQSSEPSMVAHKNIGRSSHSSKSQPQASRLGNGPLKSSSTVKATTGTLNPPTSAPYSHLDVHESTSKQNKPVDSTSLKERQAIQGSSQNFPDNDGPSHVPTTHTPLNFSSPPQWAPAQLARKDAHERYLPPGLKSQHFKDSDVNEAKQMADMVHQQPLSVGTLDQNLSIPEDQHPSASSSSNGALHSYASYFPGPSPSFPAAIPNQSSFANTLTQKNGHFAHTTSLYPPQSNTLSSIPPTLVVQETMLSSSPQSDLLQSMSLNNQHSYNRGHEQVQSHGYSHDGLSQGTQPHSSIDASFPQGEYQYEQPHSYNPSSFSSALHSTSSTSNMANSTQAALFQSENESEVSLLDRISTNFFPHSLLSQPSFPGSYHRNTSHMGGSNSLFESRLRAFSYNSNSSNGSTSVPPADLYSQNAFGNLSGGGIPGAQLTHRYDLDEMANTASAISSGHQSSIVRHVSQPPSVFDSDEQYLIQNIVSLMEPSPLEDGEIFEAHDSQLKGSKEDEKGAKEDHRKDYRTTETFYWDQLPIPLPSPPSSPKSQPSITFEASYYTGLSPDAPSFQPLRQSQQNSSSMRDIKDPPSPS